METLSRSPSGNEAFRVKFVKWMVEDRSRCSPEMFKENSTLFSEVLKRFLDENPESSSVQIRAIAVDFCSKILPIFSKNGLNSQEFSALQKAVEVWDGRSTFSPILWPREAFFDQGIGPARSRFLGWIARTRPTHFFDTYHRFLKQNKDLEVFCYELLEFLKVLETTPIVWERLESVSLHWNGYDALPELLS